MNRDTERVAIGEIIVADRLREEYGDVSALAESIRAHGLLHPITVDQDNRLIAGERRLRAMKQLGYTEVEVRRWTLLDENERREIELEENIRRKDLTPYERNKNLVELAEVAKQVEAKTISPESGKTPKVGRPPKSIISEAKIAERIGVPRQTIQEAQKHVATADSFPVFQKPEWKAYHVLEAAEVIERLPEEDRQPVADLIDQPYCPPQAAIPVLRNLAKMDAPERKEILTLATSEDSRDRSLAMTRAAELPPMPDERYLVLEQAVTQIRRAIKIHPNDPEVKDLQRIAIDLKQVIATIQERNRGRSTQRTA